MTTYRDDLEAMVWCQPSSPSSMPFHSLYIRLSALVSLFCRFVILWHWCVRYTLHATVGVNVYVRARDVCEGTPAPSPFVKVTLWKTFILSIIITSVFASCYTKPTTMIAAQRIREMMWDVASLMMMLLFPCLLFVVFLVLSFNFLLWFPFPFSLYCVFSR